MKYYLQDVLTGSLMSGPYDTYAIAFSAILPKGLRPMRVASRNFLNIAPFFRKFIVHHRHTV
jgi:hypothetical protein